MRQSSEYGSTKFLIIKLELLEFLVLGDNALEFQHSQWTLIRYEAVMVLEELLFS